MTTDPKASGKFERDARLRWIPLDQMRVSDVAQREQTQAWVDHLVAHFDLEQMGTFTVSHRGDAYYIIDGQHRVAALRELGFTSEKVQCWVYEGLKEEQEADNFLTLNNNLSVQAMPKFRVGVTAGRAEECDINRIVLAQGMVVTHDQVEGGVGAVGTLRRVYRRTNPETLGRTLRIAFGAYGDLGLQAAVIDGIAHVCARYNGDLDEAEATRKLANAPGGVGTLLTKAEHLRNTTGNYKAICVAAAVVETINRGKGGKKLPAWWKDA